MAREALPTYRVTRWPVRALMFAILTVGAIGFTGKLLADGFADMVRAHLTPDPLGDWLAGWARRAVRARRQPAKIAAVPTAFLDRSIVDGCRSLGAQARFAIARTLGGG